MKKDADEKAIQAQTDLIMRYKKCFGTPEGIEVLHDLVRNHFIGASTTYFDRSGNTNPYSLYFNEGARNVVLRILNVLEKTPEDIVKIHTEAIGVKNGYFRE